MGTWIVRFSSTSAGRDLFTATNDQHILHIHRYCYCYTIHPLWIWCTAFASCVAFAQHLKINRNGQDSSRKQYPNILNLLGLARLQNASHSISSLPAAVFFYQLIVHYFSCHGANCSNRKPHNRRTQASTMSYTIISLMMNPAPNNMCGLLSADHSGALDRSSPWVAIAFSC